MKLPVHSYGNRFQPEVMDNLERRIIQMKIEREALKKEKDEGSTKHLEKLEDDLKKLETEYKKLEDVWKAEKGSLQDANAIKSEIEKARTEMVQRVAAVI